jgi:NitT/TauT family transport system permease protein
MSQATQAIDPVAPSVVRPDDRPLWISGIYAAASWAAAALVTKSFPNVVPWGSDDLFAILVGLAALGLAALAIASPRSGRFRDTLEYYGPWFIAIGVWLTLWELATAKTGWLPKPFFSPPTGLLHVYVTEWRRLLI